MFTKKDKVELVWAIISLGLGQLFVFKQMVPDLGPVVSTSAKFSYGMSFGMCMSSVFFFMGIPVIETVAAFFKKKGK